VSFGGRRKRAGRLEFPRRVSRLDGAPSLPSSSVERARETRPTLTRRCRRPALSLSLSLSLCLSLTSSPPEAAGEQTGGALFAPNSPEPTRNCQQRAADCQRPRAPRSGPRGRGRKLEVGRGLNLNGATNWIWPAGCQPPNWPPAQLKSGRPLHLGPFLRFPRPSKRPHKPPGAPRRPSS